MNNKNILKISAALLLATSSLVGYTAKADSDLLRDSVGITVGGRMGTLGLGAETAFPINDSTAVRANIAYLPLLNRDFTSTEGDIKSTGSLSASNINGMALVDWHPFANAFRFSFGVAYNHFNIEAKDLKVDFAKLDIKGFSGPIKALTDALVDEKTLTAEQVAFVQPILEAVGESVQPTLGPINWTGKLKSNIAPVAGFGADNSTDPDASFVYGFDVAVMLVNPELDTTSDSKFISFSANGKETIEKAFNEAKDKVPVSPEATAKVKALIDQIGTASSVSMFGLKTFGKDVMLASLFGGKTLIPVVMGHIAFPIQ